MRSPLLTLPLLAIVACSHAEGQADPRNWTYDCVELCARTVELPGGGYHIDAEWVFADAHAGPVWQDASCEVTVTEGAHATIVGQADYVPGSSELTVGYVWATGCAGGDFDTAVVTLEHPSYGPIEVTPDGVHVTDAGQAPLLEETRTLCGMQDDLYPDDRDL